MQVPDEIYRLDWYKLPIKYQKAILVVIAANREPRYFTGCKLIRANRSTFKEARISYSRSYFVICILIAFFVVHF